MKQTNICRLSVDINYLINFRRVLFGAPCSLARLVRLWVNPVLSVGLLYTCMKTISVYISCENSKGQKAKALRECEPSAGAGRQLENVESRIIQCQNYV